MNNIQIAICDNLMGLAEETKDWKPSENVLKRRFVSLCPLLIKDSCSRKRSFSAGEASSSEEGRSNATRTCFKTTVWPKRSITPSKCGSRASVSFLSSLYVTVSKSLDCLLDAITHDLRKEPIARATDLVRLFEGNTRCSVQWEASLADVHNEPSEM